MKLDSREAEIQTLLLDCVMWDLVLDVRGNIALASNPYALAQSAASKVRTFRGEVYYDTTQGIDYFETILGKKPPLSLINARVTAAALTVPEVVAAKCFITSIIDRAIQGPGGVPGGQVQVTDANGTTAGVGF